MKRRIVYCLMLILTSLASCKKDDDEKFSGDWSRASDFEGVPRNGAFSFTIGNNAYVGTGYDGRIRLNDVWVYDSGKNSWSAVAPFPGKARSNTVAFTANGKGYVGTGYDGDNALNDFWEYDPTANKWKEIAPLPTILGRYDAVAFAIANKGYVGTGRDNDKKDQQDFYSYDPIANSWKKVASLGIKRTGAFAFVIGNKAFVGGGTNNGTYSQEFYQYNAATDNWIEKKDLDQSDNKDNDDDYKINRANASTFVIAGVGYVIGGSTGYALNSTWRYEESQDRWIQVDNFEGAPREYAVSFSFNGRGYVATGNSGTVRYDDNWRFDPNAPSDN